MRHDDLVPGTVWLVGAGPGDPDLLTRKAEGLLRAADIVFHDALVGVGVLELIPERVERVSVGKRSGRHSKGQASIDALLVAAARAGKRVVRLKGGDPSIFGRSTEEIDACARHGIPVRICPGVTAASAAAAAGCASLTLRGRAPGVTFVTAHPRAGYTLDVDWSALVSSGTTLAIYMGRAAAPRIMVDLIGAGLSPETPVLVALSVSLQNERLIRGRLSALSFLVRTIGDRDPALLLIGDACAQRTEVTQLCRSQGASELESGSGQ